MTLIPFVSVSEMNEPNVNNENYEINQLCNNKVKKNFIVSFDFPVDSAADGRIFGILPLRDFRSTFLSVN